MDNNKIDKFTFYELYADILQGLDDTSAGKLVSYICEFEFADTKPTDNEMTDKENFYWSNLSDMLEEVKETECAGKKPKKYNLQSEHFTFYDTYYKAMKLMNMKKRGTFIKAICAYMFGREELKFEDKTIQGYFNLCKRKMDLSKKRKNSASRGKGLRSSISAGKDEQRTIEVEEQQPVPSTEEQNASTRREELTYSDFRKAYPDIQGKLFGMAERYITALDWTKVAAKVESDEELRKERDIFYLVKTYSRKYAQKG